MKENLFDLSRCVLCPRRCGANRAANKRGYCGAPAEIVAARASLHPYEEPCIAGEKGTGTVFFAYCQLGCVYCQNYAISRRDGAAAGKILTPRELAAAFCRLEKIGAATIGLVTPTHYAPPIIEALKIARAGIAVGGAADGRAALSTSPAACDAAADGQEFSRLTIPAVWNSSGYERPEIIALIAPDIEIFMPDFKYFSPEAAARYSSAPDYPSQAMAAITAMVEAKGRPVYRQAGETALDAKSAEIIAVQPNKNSGTTNRSATPSRKLADARQQNMAANNLPSAGDAPLLASGVIVRHLVLPGRRKESIALVQSLYEHFGDDIILSLLRQYTPISGASYLADYPELARKITTFEYESVVEAALKAGFKNAYIQERGCASEDFIPAFDGSGL